MPNSRVRISTHIAQEAAASVNLDGDTWCWVTQQCPTCGGMSLASNGVMLRCPACEWSGQVIRHKRCEERVQDEW